MDIEDAVEQMRTQIMASMWKVGTVTGSSSSPARVIVTVQGGSMTVPRVNTYTTPTVGKVALLAATAIGYIAIGEIA